MAAKRNFFREGLNSELTQGSVFYGAYAEDYQTELNYGLIITARCDISQDKAPIYSYLPLISFDNWLCGDFTSILYRTLSKSVYNNLVTAFENIGGSKLLLETYPLDKLIENFSSEGNGSKRKKFMGKVRDYNQLQKLLDSEVQCLEVRDIISSSTLFKKESTRIINDLISQNLLGFYFIDDVTNDGAHVVKLRDVYHLKSKHAKGLRKGINLPNVKYFDSDSEKLSFTVGEINSPYIEHILQKFSSIFVRVGIDDPDKKIIEELMGD